MPLGLDVARAHVCEVVARGLDVGEVDGDPDGVAAGHARGCKEAFEEPMKRVRVKRGTSERAIERMSRPAK